MLSKAEKAKTQGFDLKRSCLKEIILAWEEKNKKNIISIYRETDNSYNDIKKTLRKFIYSNGSIFDVNKQDIVDFFYIPKCLMLKGVDNYLKELSETLAKNPNKILLLTNTTPKYLEIINLSNQYGIITLLISDDKEDIYLEHSNLIVFNSTNVKENFLKLKPKVLKTDEFIKLKNNEF